MNLRQEIEALHRASFGWAMSCCRNQRQEAEDVLQVAYLKILEGRARFAGRSSFRTWLFAVINRTAQEARRRRWLHAVLLERWHAKEADGKGFSVKEEPGDAQDQNQQLSRALAQLSPRQQEILHLVFYQDLTVEESARVLGVSIGSARTHYERGKERLRTLLSLEVCHGG
jgi:RNA polymerase sigma-70 factor (ECF subfamily)